MVDMNPNQRRGNKLDAWHDLQRSMIMGKIPLQLLKSIAALSASVVCIRSATRGLRCMPSDHAELVS